MKTALQDFGSDLTRLHRLLEHPSHYERAVTYFLEKFAGDAEFIRHSEPDDSPAVGSILRQVVEQMMATQVRLDQPASFRLKGHAFLHGNAILGQRAIVYFLFPDAGLGVAALIPGINGAMEVARFKLPGRLPKPELN